MADDPLSSYHPLVREWFLSRHGSPTPVQAEAWPRIARGEHLLALAPTGSGKTLAAFLAALSRIASGEYPSDMVSVLYVSPLKALGEDMRRNLEEPAAELRTLFADRGSAFPDLRVVTRTGDTSQSERRKMLSRPPAILVTTPESLCIMLDAPSSRKLLESVRYLVLDEIHALAGNKRGALLACAVGRLAFLAGEFQRIALSATARPAEAVAAFVGGFVLERGEDGRASYRPREVSIVSPPSTKRIELGVEWPAPAPLGPRAVAAGAAAADGADSTRYAALIPALGERIRATRTLIVFTDARRRAEKIAFLLNEAFGEGTAWAHHGSLSKETRRLVEERLKAGELGCVAATASLELGIDIGSVDEVVLAGAPPAVSSALQRIGRSGHGVGQSSKGRIYPFHGMDLVLAAAVAKGVEELAVEETKPVSAPLDILAQVLLALVAEAPRQIDALYDIVRTFPPFSALSRGLYDSVVELLAGRYAEARIRELEPRVDFDRLSGLLTARAGARYLLSSSGGAIPDRGLYSMRLKGSRTKIGELDEEFVWERKPGDAFTLGAQSWRIVEIGPEAVEVVPLGREADFMPFWKADSRFRSPEISRRALELLDRLDGLDEEGGAALLAAEYRFDGDAAAACARFVASQKQAGGGRPSLPTSRRLVLEANDDPTRRGDAARIVLHSLRGRAINEPIAMALAAAWEEDCGLPVQALSDDDSILLLVPRLRAPDGGRGAGEAEPVKRTVSLLLGLARQGRLEALVRSRLEGTGFFGAQFRENAGRSLLLPRGLPGKRMPLWISRLRAKKLFEALRAFDDSPVIVETWRSCLGELFDLAGARELAESLASGSVEVAVFESRHPSPFAREAVFKETNEFLYKGDALEARARSSVSDRVVAEALRSSALRPRLDPALVDDLAKRLKRLVPGWAPEDGRALAEWVKERVLLPADELPGLVAIASPGLAAALEADPTCDGRLRRITLHGATAEVLVHAERESALLADPGAHVAEWLRREGPVGTARISALFGLADDDLGPLIEELSDGGEIVVDAFERGSEEIRVVDAQNLEILLRRSRAAARPRVEARPAGDLMRLVTATQGLPVALRAEGAGGGAEEGRALGQAATVERLGATLARLCGAAAPAGLWEAEILPARLPGFRPELLDMLLAGGRWQWFGAGRGNVAFAKAEDLELFLTPRLGSGGRRRSSRLLPPSSPPLDFWSIRDGSGGGTRETALDLWEEVWQGLVAADSFGPVREGLGDGFGKDLPELGPTGPDEASFGARRRIPRALCERWRRGAPVGGRWFRLDIDEEGEEDRDALDLEGLAAARVRALVGRYGMVCRELLEREGPGLGWGELFPTMRRLELSGEILAGHFFDGLDGAQFVGAEALGLFARLGEAALPAPLWLNALDPAAAALYAAAERQGLLPARLAVNRFCLLGGRVVAASTRSYRELALELRPEDPALPALLGLFASARKRSYRPEGRILLEMVNGQGASACPYAGALREVGFEADRGRMVLW